MCVWGGCFWWWDSWARGGLLSDRQKAYEEALRGLAWGSLTVGIAALEMLQ